MICLYCKKEFEISSRNKKLCSEECKLKRERVVANEWYKKNKEKRLLKVKQYQSTIEYKYRKRIYDKEYRELNRDLLKLKDKKKREKKFYTGNRNKVLKRDNYKCVNCGSEKQLVVHHIDFQGRIIGSAKDYNMKVNNNLSNLETLCRACHIKIHLYN